MPSGKSHADPIPLVRGEWGKSPSDSNRSMLILPEKLSDLPKATCLGSWEQNPDLQVPGCLPLHYTASHPEGRQLPAT